VETAELDVALEELETRLERLRSLYEQYFMGIEKIEPQIARKDVDRRIYVLRREKIRNTAKRFKLQTIIQRYNTFQQYWMRICREIENGTYKRHLLKAQKNGDLLTIAARRRLGRQARTSQPPEGASPSKPPSVAPSVAASAPPLAAAPALVPVAPATPPPSAQSATALRPPGSPPIPQRPPLPGRPAATTSAPSPIPAAPSAPATPPPAAKPTAIKPAPVKFESLDLDMDFMGDWDPGAKRAAPKPVASAPAKPAASAPAPRASAPAPTPLTAPKPVAAPVAARPASIPPAPVAVPPRPASSRPPTAPARPLPARIPASPRIPAAAPPPKPVAAPPPKPAAAAPPKPAAPAAAAASPNVDDARLRDLHSKLQQAKQQTKEANVSFEGLAKSIRATEAKLREQHKNRKIEFDVVIKDGKAVVKPIVR
jgi:hypothetical protein